VPLDFGTPCSTDGNQCTDDYCVAGLCQHVFSAFRTPCIYDDDACTDDYCVLGECRPTDNYVPSNGCELNTCDPLTGIVTSGDSCSDIHDTACHTNTCVTLESGSPPTCVMIVNVGDTCVTECRLGECTVEGLCSPNGGPQNPCDDNNACTSEYCDTDTNECIRNINCNGQLLNDGCIRYECCEGECKEVLLNDIICYVSDSILPGCFGTGICNYGVCELDPVNGICAPPTDLCKQAMCAPNGTCVETPIPCFPNARCNVAHCEPETGECVQSPKQCPADTECFVYACDEFLGECLLDIVACEDTGNPLEINCCGPDGACYKVVGESDNLNCTYDYVTCDGVSHHDSTCMDTLNDPCKTFKCCEEGCEVVAVTNGDICPFNLCGDEGACIDGQCILTTNICEVRNGDENPCVVWFCDDNTCVSRPSLIEGGPAITCGDKCNIGYCDLYGYCITTINQNIDDNNICTNDLCDPVTGIITHVPVANGTTCDSNPCGDTSVCIAGSCVLKYSACIDLNGDIGPCDRWVCNHETGLCESIPTFKDGDAPIPCDLDIKCSTGLCLSSGGCGLTPINIDDNNPCTDDLCDYTTGAITHKAKICPGGACYNSSCNRQSGECDPFFFPSETPCGPSTPCQVYVCNGNGGCNQVTALDYTACLPENKCNLGYCGSGACIDTGVSELPIDDGIECTVDSCNPITGNITHIPQGDVSCGDGNVICGQGICSSVGDCILTPIEAGTTCDINDQCRRATCVGNATGPTACLVEQLIPINATCSAPVPPVYDTQCVQYRCDADLGCTSRFISGACVPTNKCKLGQCQSGLCVQSITNVTINDNNNCTTDSCDPLLGVIHTANVGLLCGTAASICEEYRCAANATCVRTAKNPGVLCGAGSEPCRTSRCIGFNCVRSNFLDGVECNGGNTTCASQTCKTGVCVKEILAGAVCAPAETCVDYLCSATEQCEGNIKNGCVNCCVARNTCEPRQVICPLIFPVPSCNPSCQSTFPAARSFIEAEYWNQPEEISNDYIQLENKRVQNHPVEALTTQFKSGSGTLKKFVATQTTTFTTKPSNTITTNTATANTIREKQHAGETHNAKTQEKVKPGSKIKEEWCLDC
jgi:hypothetical protein